MITRSPQDARADKVAHYNEKCTKCEWVYDSDNDFSVYVFFLFS